VGAVRPYPAMKDSGAVWLGEVPEHWEVRPIRGVGRIFKGKGGSKADEAPTGVPCVRYGDLYTRHEFFIRGTRAYLSESEAAGYTVIRYGDVLFAASGETVEDIGKSAVNLLSKDSRCGGDVLVLRPKVRVVPEYLGYAADAPSSRRQKACMGRGFTVVHLYGGQLKALVIPLPTIPEQVAIVRFLDHVHRRIRRYIRAKQEMIKLLEEQKQAIIHRAVTDGLDPDLPLKPSGVGWLGDVPEHWSVASLRFRYEQCLGKMVDAKRATRTRLLPYLRNVDVQWDQINTDDLPRIDIGEQEQERFTLRHGDLLVCEGRHLGRAAIWRGELAVCAFQKALHRLRAKDARADVPRFLYYCLFAVHYKDAFGASSSDNSIPHLTGVMLRAFKFPFPPHSEQHAIAAYLDSSCASIDRATNGLANEVVAMREYRTRLISDVVTGKLDVREAAANLPDEQDDLELEGGAGAGVDDSSDQADQHDTVLEEADA